MSNGKNVDTNEYNCLLMECIKNVAKEMAHSLIKTKDNQDDECGEFDSDNLKRIFDVELPKNVFQGDKRNKSNNLDNKDNFFDDKNDDYDFKIVKNSMSKNVYERTIEGKLRKEKKLEMLRNKKKEEDLSHIKKRPKINLLSQKICEKNQNDTKPIQNRVQEIVDKKYLKIDKLKQQYRDIADWESSKITSCTHYDEKKFDEWLTKQSKWDSNKKNKIENSKQDNERLETENMKSMYHPNIDRKSEILMRSKILSTENSKIKESVYDKLYNLKDEKYNKINQKLADSIPTFNPLINKQMPNFNKAKNCKTKNYTEKKEIKINRSKNNYNSVEIRNNLDVIYEDNQRKEDNYKNSKKNRLNASMLDTYNYPNKESNLVKEEVPDLISRYREALEINKNTNLFSKNFSNKAIKKSHNRSYQEVSKDQASQNSIVKINKKQPNERKVELDNQNLLYKINVSNASAWNQNKENCIVYNPQISNIKTTIIKNSAK